MSTGLHVSIRNFDKGGGGGGGGQVLLISLPLLNMYSPNLRTVVFAMGVRSARDL